MEGEGGGRRGAEVGERKKRKRGTSENEQLVITNIYTIASPTLHTISHLHFQIIEKRWNGIKRTLTTHSV